MCRCKAKTSLCDCVFILQYILKKARENDWNMEFESHFTQELKQDVNVYGEINLVSVNGGGHTWTFLTLPW